MVGRTGGRYREANARERLWPNVLAAATLELFPSSRWRAVLSSLADSWRRQTTQRGATGDATATPYSFITTGRQALVGGTIALPST